MFTPGFSQVTKTTAAESKPFPEGFGIHTWLKERAGKTTSTISRNGSALSMRGKSMTYRLQLPKNQAVYDRKIGSETLKGIQAVFGKS